MSTPRPPVFDRAFFSENAKVAVINVSTLCDLCDREADGEGCPRCSGAHCKSHAAVSGVRCCAACEREFQNLVDKRPEIPRRTMYIGGGAMSFVTIVMMIALPAPALVFGAFTVYAGFLASLILQDRAEWRARAAFLMTRPEKRPPKPARHEDVCVLFSNRPPAPANEVAA